MKIKTNGILIATLVTASPLSLADVKKNSDQNESITVCFARHGKTLLNTSDRVQGWVDSPLTGQGKGDALAEADLLHQAENYAQMKARTQAALETMVENAEKESDRNVLAVSSGNAIRFITSDLTSSPAKNLSLPNAAVGRITYRDGQYSVPEISTMK